MSNLKAKQVKEAFEEGFRMARQEHGRYPSEKQWVDAEEAWGGGKVQRNTTWTKRVKGRLRLTF